MRSVDDRSAVLPDDPQDRAEGIDDHGGVGTAVRGEVLLRTGQQ
ncbi:hypothetical protein ACWDR0_29775 [Streptomyces sp. NPDC003691]